MLRFLARLLAVVFAALFVCTTVVVVFVRPISVQLLEPPTYKNVWREQRVAERLPELAADTIDRAMTKAGRRGERATVGSTGDFATWLTAFSRADLQALIGALLPADYVNGQLDGAIDQFFGYMHSDAAKPAVTLSLVDLKQRLSGGVLEDAYVKVLQGKPPCTGEMNAMELPVGCCPPEDRLRDVRMQFREMTGPAMRELPDSVDLFAPRNGAQAESVYRTMAGFRGQIRTCALLARWSWVLSVLFLAGTVVFGARSVRGLLLWCGVPCLIAGGVAAILALPGATMGGWFFHSVIAPQLPPEVPVLAVGTVLGLVTAVAKVILGAALKSAAWLAVGGLAAVALAMLFKAKPLASTTA